MNPTLFDVDMAGSVQHAAPMTSVNAARSITGRTERELMAVFVRGGEWTADELVRELRTVYPPTAVSALSRLHKHRLIVATGKTRPSARGREQIVWIAALEREETVVDRGPNE